MFILIPVSVASFPEEKDFFVEPSFDHLSRRKVEMELLLTTNYINFYASSIWWEDLSEEKRREYEKIMYGMGNDFERNIYPWMTDNFGNMPLHQITGSRDRITVVLHPMEDGSGGYFRTGDQYSIYQYPRSNEGNILYLNANLIEDGNISGYLAHEYVHLVTFNEKNKEFGINEEVWLNELRAEIIITILGYNDIYEESNLKERKGTFLRSPDVSVTEWTERISDYGVTNIFGHYLLDHYGEDIFSDSLGIDMVGISSLNHALATHEKRFSEVFTEWTIAIYLNDCSHGEYYCFKNRHLENLTVSPLNAAISSEREEPLSIEEETKNWAGNWYRIEGDEGTLHFDFYGKDGFVVPYILCQKEKDCEIDFLDLNKKGEGGMIIEDFTRDHSLTIIPSLQKKIRDFNGVEDYHSFRWEVEIEKKEEDSKEDIRIKELRQRLDSLEEKIEELYFLIIGKRLATDTTFQKLENDLYFGMTNSEEVRNLQKFLKEQGEHIYPEGLVTGNFYEMTRRAVIRFQEENRKEILEPLGLSEGTGYVGKYTREFINFLLEK